jgi:lactoylglutathione lyase
VIAIERSGLILHTERYKECVAFYRDVIGLPVEFTKHEPDEPLTCLTLGQAYLMIETGGVARNATKTRGENPVTIRLNVRDVEAAANFLRGHGIQVSVVSFPWGVIGRFSDPDGNPCQLRDQARFGP